MKRRVWRLILRIILIVIAVDTGFIIYDRMTERPSERAARVGYVTETDTPSPTPTLSGRDWLNAILNGESEAEEEAEGTAQSTGRERLNALMNSGSNKPANAASKAATEELLRTGTVTYGGHTYTMPWYRVFKEWVWEVFPEMRRICSYIFGPSRK